MSKLYVNTITPQSGSSVNLSGSMKITGNLEVTGTLHAKATDFVVSANSTTFGDAASDSLTINASTASVPNGLNFGSNTLVLSGSRIGIGTSIPAAPLHLYAAATVATIPQEAIRLDVSDEGVDMNVGGGGPSIDFYVGETSGNNFGGLIGVIREEASDADSDAAMVFHTATDDQVRANDREKMRITSAGKVGIGVTDPDSVLEVFGTSTQLKLSNNAADYATLAVGTNGDLTIETVDAAAAAANIQITADGTAELAGTTVTLDSSGGITLDAGGGTITFADDGASLGTITSAGYSGAAGSATTVTVADSTANTNFPIVFHDESNGLLDDTGALRYNPSTGTLLAPNLTVAGTTTTVNTVTMNAANAIVFEGASADVHETTLTIVDPTADRTINLPNQSGTIPVLAAASNTAVTSTPEELNLLDGSAANTVVNSKAVIYGSSGELAGTLSTAAQTSVTSLGTLTALTVDDVAINGKVITMTGASGDTATMTVGSNGDLTIATVDTAAAAANIQITADGTVDIDSAGVLTLDSGAAINLEPAAGSVILLDGTISVDAGVVTGATSVTSTSFSAGTTVITDDSIVMTPSSGDTATIAAGTNGTLTITTVDTAAAAANVGFVVDGAFDIDAAGAVTIDGSAITIGGDSDVAIDIDSSTLDIDASGAITIDSTSTIVISGDAGATLSDDTEALAYDGSGNVDFDAVALDIDASGALTIDSATSISIGTNADKPIDIDSTTLDIDASGAITVDSTSTIVISGDGGATLSDDTEALVYDGSGNVDFDAVALDIDASGAITIDSTSTIVISGDGGATFGDDTESLAYDGSGNLDLDAVALDMDLTDSSSITITSSEAAEDLTIEQVGANDSSIIITAAGTGADAIKIDATAGSMLVAPNLADQKTLKVGKNGAVEMVFSPHDTAASEKWSLTNTSGDAADAIAMTATAGGITMTTAASGVKIAGTTPKLTMGDAGAEDTMIVFDGNAQDFRIGLDDGTDTLEIGHGSTHGTNTAITVDSSGQITKLNVPAAAIAQASDHILFFDGGATGAPKVESVDDFLTAIAGSGVSVSSSQLTVSSASSAADDISAGDAAVTITTTSGNITIDAAANDSDIIFKGTDDSADTTFLTIDGSEAGAAAFNSTITTGDLITSTKDVDGEFVALKLTNQSDAANTTGIVSLQFDLEDTSGNAVDSAKIAVKKEASFTSTAGTQDSSVVFSTSKNGSLTEQATLDSNGELTLANGGITIPQYVTHAGDADTRLSFTPDKLVFEIGGVNLLKLEEAGQDIVVFNEDGGDVDFRVESNNESHMIFMEAATNRISIGDSTNSPTATLEITNHASSGATGVPLVQLNSNDVDKIAVDVNAANTTANVIDVVANALTTGKAIFIDHNDTATTAVTPTGIHIDFDKSGVTGDGVTSTFTGLDVDINDAATNHANADVTQTGVTIAVASANAQGTLLNLGMQISATGADENIQLALVDDGSVMAFGADSEVTLTHVHDVGLTMTHTATGDNTPMVLQLKSEEDAIIANEVIASIEFAAGDSDGTDGATVAAGIHAIAEGTFAADANATKLVFTTGVSETAASSATAKMTLSSAGLLTIADDLVIKDGGTIGSATTAAALTVASNGLLTAGVGITSTAAANTLGATSFNDANITNVGDISLDSISSDGSLVTINAPAKVAQGSSGGASALIIDNDDTNQKALEIDAANIDANVIDITADALTTSNVINISADALTSGDAMHINSNSASTTARSILKLENEHASATGVSTLEIIQKSTGPIMNVSHGSVGSVLQLKYKEVTHTCGTDNDFDEVADFFTAGMIPIALATRVTTELSSGGSTFNITKIGTQTTDNSFGAYANNELEQVNDVRVASYAPTAGTGQGGTFFSQNTELKLTYSATPAGGALRLVLYYYDITAPTS